MQHFQTDKYEQKRLPNFWKAFDLVAGTGLTAMCFLTVTLPLKISSGINFSSSFLLAISAQKRLPDNRKAFASVAGTGLEPVTFGL
tara:strand:- start:5 stop:262 length:258 start_codon:yes stop_codon:yes gene_type:complete